MSKNLIPVIAEMLGVKLGEEFKIKGHDGLTYKFDDNGLRVTYDNGVEMSAAIANTFANTFVSLLWEGKCEIIKLPWKPKYDDVFYTFLLDFKDDGDGYVWKVAECFWDDSPVDFAFLKAGWAFRTRAEAEATLPNVAKELGVEYEL